MQSAVLVRMPEPLAAAVNASAEAAGLSAAAWLRGLAADMADAPREARPTPPSRKRVIPAEDLAEVSRFANLVERNNGALVQMTKALREAGATELHADAEAVLSDLRSLAADLHDIVDMLR